MPELIKPRPGPQTRPSDVVGIAIIASRSIVNGVEDRALRMFTGDVGDYVVGDHFDTVHRDNGRPCGVWTVEAVIIDGRVASGHISDGIGSYRVNELG